LASPWSITALNSKSSTYAGKKIGIIGDQGVIQTGTVGGVQTKLYTIYQAARLVPRLILLLAIVRALTVRGSRSSIALIPPRAISRPLKAASWDKANTWVWVRSRITEISLLMVLSLEILRLAP
jgi:hypothetical protein